MKNTVNERILMLKTELNLPDIDFCSSAGISVGTLHKIKKGDSISKRTLANIAHHLQVDMNWLVEGIGEMKVEPVQQQVSTTWKDKAFSTQEKYIDHLKEEVAFLRTILTNMSGKAAANFNFPPFLAGVLDKNVEGSVRVAA